MAESSPDNATSKTLFYLVPDQRQLISSEQKNTASNILMIIRFLTIVIYMPLTVCNLTVFSHKRMRSATGTYVIGLTLAQIVVMLDRAAIAIHRFIVGEGPKSLFWMYFWEGVLNYSGIVARRGSQVVTCLVSVERLYAVLRPLHVKTFFLSQYSMLLTLGTYLTSALWHIYLVVNTNVVTVTTNSTTTYTYVPSSFYLSHKDFCVGLSFSAKVVQVFVALTLQILLNMLTVCALRRYNLTTRDVQSTMRNDIKLRSERQMTRTILMTSVFSVILTIPLTVANIWDDLEPTISSVNKSYHNVQILVLEIGTNCSALGGGGIDFCCYVRLSSRYRNVLCKVFGYNKNSSLYLKSKSPTYSENTNLKPATNLMH